MGTENAFPPYEVCEDSAGLWELGDENGMVLVRLDSREDAEKVAQKLRALAAEASELRERVVALSVIVGRVHNIARFGSPTVEANARLGTITELTQPGGDS